MSNLVKISKANKKCQLCEKSFPARENRGETLNICGNCDLELYEGESLFLDTPFYSEFNENFLVAESF